jgi:hypothetical protein
MQTSLQIECSTYLNISIIIADLNGKIVFMKSTFIEEGIGTVPIDLLGLHKGFYIVNVTSPQATKSIKLIIQ